MCDQLLYRIALCNLSFTWGLLLQNRVHNQKSVDEYPLSEKLKLPMRKFTQNKRT